MTLWQPYASLIAIGAKRIETRSWKTSYRGPLAIHAAKTTKGFDTLPGDCEGTVEGGWRYGYIGDYQAGYCFRTSDEGRRGDTFLVGLDGVRCEISPPLGAVVAFARLVDVVPIVAADSCLSSFENPRQVEPSAHAAVDDQVIIHQPHNPRYHTTVLCEQAYGDYTPGRFAWVFDEEVTPVDPPVPARGGQQLWEWSPFDDNLLDAVGAP